MTSREKLREQEQARKDIVRLFSQAAKARQELADRYVLLARKLAERNRISLRAYNRTHCRKCCAYFTSKTLRVRTRPGTVVYACLRCGHMTRIPRR
jgi:ribonuclease P protein subunit RPR2